MSQAIRENPFDRALPSSVEAERAILGAIILDNRLIDQAIALLKLDDFYIPSHRRIFVAMIELSETQSEINPILIGNLLRREHSLETVGGLSFITDLTYGLPHATNITHYAKIVRGKSLLRWIVKESARTMNEAIGEEEEPDRILATATERFAEMREKSATSGNHGGEGPELRQLYDDHLYLLKAGVNPAIPTGMEALDHLSGGGISPGELWGIGALSSQGKTTLLVQWLRDMSKRKIPCALFSLEMGAKLIALRIGAAETNVSMKTINPHAPASHLDYLLEHSEQAFTNTPAVYTDCRSISDIVQRIKVIKRKHPLKVVGIDYYGLISGYGAGRDRYENKTQELKYISSALQQRIAIDEQLGVIVPAQFNRSAWSAKEDAGPANIDGGEAFYQACDLFATLTVEKQTERENMSKARLKVQKHRNGPTGEIGLEFDRAMMRFSVALIDDGAADDTHEYKL